MTIVRPSRSGIATGTIDGGRPIMLITWKSAVAAALPALAFITTPAQAHGGYYGGRGGDDAGIAIGAGVVGLVLGAAIASGNRDRDYYYDDEYYEPRGSYYRAYPRYYSYNYDYPRYERRGWNNWRNDRHDGWNYRGRDWGQRGRRWGY
jgi:hypothetical protein